MQVGGILVVPVDYGMKPHSYHLMLKVWAKSILIKIFKVFSHVKQVIRIWNTKIKGKMTKNRNWPWQIGMLDVLHYSFVQVGEEYVQYEVTMTVFLGRIANQKKYQNGSHLKTGSH